MAKKYKLNRGELKTVLVSVQSPKASPTGKPKSVRAKVGPKYQSQDGAKNWTGRGRTPSWVIEICRTKGVTVEGFKSEDTFTRWDKWVKINHTILLPEIIGNHFINEENLNVEYIGDKVIEVHLRSNQDFTDEITEFIPVWEGQNKIAPDGYTYKYYPDVHGRIGAFIK